LGEKLWRESISLAGRRVRLAQEAEKGEAGKGSIVVLVHGTFARTASWTHTDSPLASAAKRALGNGASTRTFEWSGRNSHAARLTAGAELARYLRVLKADNPRALIHVVAHSHGGNVAAYAMRDPDARGAVASVICLGTPHILAHRRDLEPTIRVCRYTAIVVGVALSMLSALWGLMGFYLTYVGYGELPFTVLNAVIAGAMALLFVRWRRRAVRYMRDRLVPGLRAAQEEITIALQADFGSIPVLNVRAESDEAARYLRMIDRIARLPFQVWSPHALLWSVASFGILWFGGMAFTTFFPSTPQEGGAWEAALGLIFSYAASLLLAGVFFVLLGGTAQAVCALWPKIFRGHALGFGEDGFLKNYLVAISASLWPKTTGTLRDVPLRLSGPGLYHSRLYNDQQSIGVVATWLEAWSTKVGDGHVEVL
jgi:hypothetical protein